MVAATLIPDGSRDCAGPLSVDVRDVAWSRSSCGLVIAAVGALALGGVLDTAGAMIYACTRPDLVPTGAATTSCLTCSRSPPPRLRYAVVAFWVLSRVPGAVFDGGWGAPVAR